MTVLATGRPSRSGEANSTRHEAVASSGQPAVDLTRSPPRRARTRRPIRSQFKGFDDGFDPAAVSQPPKRFDGSSQPKETQEEPSSQVRLHDARFSTFRVYKRRWSTSGLTPL